MYSLCNILPRTYPISGVFLSLNGVTVLNNGYVLASSIGGNDDGILCNTDRSDCCRASDNPNGSAQGHWYDPEGNEVGSFTEELAKDSRATQNFFARNRGSGIVRLYPSGNPSERGRFRCEIPNASGNTETQYVNIGECFMPLWPMDIGTYYLFS